MDLRKLKKLIDLVEESGISELEVSEGEEKVRIVKRVASAPYNPVATAGGTSTPQARETSDGARSIAGKAAGQIVRSPLVGTFNCAADPGADPLVKIGQTVKPGDLLCVIEAMNEQHEIASEFAGTVSAILVDNGQAVEYGEPLFVID